MLRQSRSLFHQLRAQQDSSLTFDSEGRKPRPGTTVKAAESARQPVPEIPSREEVAAARMHVNDVLLTGGEDDAAGVVSIPSLLPTPDADSAPQGIEQTGAKKRARMGIPKKIQKWQSDDGTFWKRNLKKGTTKVQRLKTWLHREMLMEIDLHPPQYDNDDYHMPIVLVAGTQEEDEDDEESAEAPAESGDSASELGMFDRKLTDIKPTLAYAWGDLQTDELPDDFHKRMEGRPYEKTVPPRMVLQWAPSNLWYHPLYFQDVGLERYGHTHKPWIQPFVSSTKFFGQAVGLPYQMVLHPPRSREFALGYYQPGEWAPKKHYQIPFNEEAAATEFLWITGLILLIP